MTNKIRTNRRIKKRVNLTLDPKLYEALDKYSKENKVLKTDLFALLLMEFFYSVDQLSPDIIELLKQVDVGRFFGQLSPYENRTLDVPELQNIWRRILAGKVRDQIAISSHIVRAIITDPDTGKNVNSNDDLKNDFKL